MFAPGPACVPGGARWLGGVLTAQVASPAAPATRRAAFDDTFDLNNDGKKEIFVALVSPYFCGSGGCTLLILNPDFTLNSRMTLVNFPGQARCGEARGCRDEAAPRARERE
jgi:hypothetical protein